MSVPGRFPTCQVSTRGKGSLIAAASRQLRGNEAARAVGIDITIQAGQDESSSSVSASGTVQHIITDQEVATFGVGDKQLKDAVKAYFGQSPNDAFLHSPTPWGDQYATYGWPQVSMVLVVQSAKILGITSEPIIVKTQDFTNNSSVKGTFNVAISDTVEDTVSSNWSTGGTLSVGQEISYGIEALGVGVKGKTSISYSQSWGIGGEHSLSVTVGSSSGVSLDLDPGQAVVAELSASRGVMKVQIEYSAYLMGSTAINYNPTFNNHHFWGLDIGSVMAGGGISNAVAGTEEIEIGYYSNSKIELKDRATGALKATHFLADAPGH